MFDEKYMKSHDKPMNTLQDAIMLYMAVEHCQGTPCDKCALKMYADGNCSTRKEEAMQFIIKQFGVQPSAQKASRKGLAAQQHFYEQLFGEKATFQSPTKEGKSQGTCAECLRSKMHSSGILYCDSFGNFVHADGYCYRFEPSAKMKEESAK